MKSIWGELRYNLKKGIFIDIVLTAQCVLAAWLFITLTSYYSDDLRSMSYDAYSIKEGYAYYTLADMGSDTMDQAGSASQDPQYLEKLETVIAQMKSDKRFTFITVALSGFPVSNALLEKHFGGPVPADFCTGSLYPGYYSKPEYKDYFSGTPHRTGFYTDAVDLNGCHLDENAFQQYHLGVSAGRPFEHGDFTFRADQKAIPLLLGDAYRPYFSVGDTFDVDCVDFIFPVEVIGFLNPHSDLVSDQFRPTDGHPVSLDYSMVYPVFDQISRVPVTEEDRMFDQSNFELSLNNGVIVTDAGVKRAKVTQIEKDLSDLFLQAGFPPLHLSGSPEGMYIFQQETQKSVLIMTGIMIIVLCFNLLCILLCLATKVQRNLKRYATELMLGQSLFSVWAGYLCEILLICLLALSITASSFRIQIMYMSLNYLWYISGFYAAVALISSLGVLYRLKGLDIEMLIRRAE